MIGYKLTSADKTTRGNTLWGEGVAHHTDGAGELCGPGWIHFYEHPLLAVLHDPIHGNFGPDAMLWECECEGKTKRDGQMKSGCTRLTTLRQIALPSITIDQRVEYAIRAAMMVYDGPRWPQWAQRWLSGVDRSAAAAEVAELSAEAARAARAAAAAAATWAARAARARAAATERAARAAAAAARAARARAAATERAARAAAAATWAARARAAATATKADEKFDLLAIAKLVTNLRGIQ